MKYQHAALLLTLILAVPAFALADNIAPQTLLLFGFAGLGLVFYRRKILTNAFLARA